MRRKLLLGAQLSAYTGRFKGETAIETRTQRPSALCLVWTAAAVLAATAHGADSPARQQGIPGQDRRQQEIVGQREAQQGRIQLTLKEAIFLALENSRAVIEARLGREEQQLGLEAAEERYRPKARIGASATAERDRKTATRVSVGPSLRVPTGGTFSLNLSQPVSGQENRSARASLNFSQPLLKGFGTEVDTAPLRFARIDEQINVRSFRDGIAGVVTSVITAYRAVSQAKRRLEISRDALERARKQLEINRTLIRAGRMAEREILQSEAEVANRELTVAGDEERLSNASSTLINTLDVDGASEVAVSEEPAILPARPDPGQSMEKALARRTDHLRALLNVKRARINLAIAQNNLLWDLRLEADVSRDTGGAPTDYGGRVNLTVPLWDRSGKRALARANNNVRRAQMGLAEVRQRIRIAVRRALHNVEVGLRQIELARKSRSLAERKLDIERSKLRQGLSSSFQLGRFEDDLVRAQNRELDTVINYRNALTSLDQTLATTLDTWNIDIGKVAP